MTTEVGSETEVKKEPEKAEPQSTSTNPDPAAAAAQQEEEKPAASSAPANPEAEPAPEAAAAAAEPSTEAAAGDAAEAPADGPATEEQATAEADKPKASEEKKDKKEKEKEKEGKGGISRFLPPWLKRSKSQSQVGPKDGAAAGGAPAKEGDAEAVKEEEEQEKKEEEEEGKEKSAAEEAKVDGEVEQAAQVSSAEGKPAEEDKEEEKHSLGSADTQPAKEEKGEESPAKEAEHKGENGVEEEEEEEEAGGEGVVERKEEEEEQQVEKQAESSILSPLRLSKKIKMVTCQVTMLDGTQFPCEVEKRAKGQYLFFKVCEQLNLLEKDYFGLAYKDNADQKCWLDPLKEIKRQIRNGPWNFAFNVKFYPPDPSQLTEDITRYLLCLQLREDIASGRLPCSFVTHALLGSYTLQAELGDYDPEEHRGDYGSHFQFAPNQTRDMEDKVLELHKSHRGVTPAQADTQFLENAKKLSMYGVDLHHAKDSEGVDIMLGVCANGLLIYKDRLRINRFAWPKILKISYKRSNFYIKIRPGETEQFESTVGFKLPNHRAAKKLWKVCVEHHTFFRLMTPEQPTKAKFLTLGSKFRYSGRTQAQTRQASSLIDRPAPYFQRTSSKRISRSLDGAPVINVIGDGEKENGRDPALDLSSDSKDEDEEEEEPPRGDDDVAAAAATAVVADAPKPPEEATDDSDGTLRKSKLRVKGENIYVRHSNLMLEDLDKTQEGVLKHQASISELKRSFMESSPEPRPSQWEKRLTSSPATSLRLQAQGSVDVDKHSKPEPAATPVSTVTAASPAAQPVVEIEETVIVEEVRKTPKPNAEEEEEAAAAAEAKVNGGGPQELPPVVVLVEGKKAGVTVCVSSDSESEEEAEYHPQVTSVSVERIKEEPEEEEEEEPKEAASAPQPEPMAEPQPEPEPSPASVTAAQPIEEVEEAKEAAEVEEAGPAQEAGPVEEAVSATAPEEATNGNGYPATEAQGTVSVEEEEDEEEEPRMNGDASHLDTDHLPQVICCSEPPVVKTEMVTISDTFAAQKTEIATKEVPIVHTETKTITYEAAQLDGSGDGEPGVLMTAQTITSESLCTTTTTHITKTLKGGLSETRIEKRIVITGDSDIDHDQALAQAIKEAKEQHPDMSVTRVVVHKETELAEDED
ncbi:band 4.1-like protein 2 isoform X2 [Engraulis encrasicolus]|uniref:band 4.1-like protein 2 isoform X2 n=1 Tax=Engraulis encrasicolus TaxID=184585 RepID=UPI002FD0C08E